MDGPGRTAGRSEGTWPFCGRAPRDDGDANRLDQTDGTWRVLWECMVVAGDLTSSRRPVLATLACGLAAATAVAVDPAGWSPFGPARFAAVAAVGAACAAIAWMGPGAASRPGDRRMVGMWSAVLILVVASAVTGVDGWYSWIGTPERRFGVLTWLLLAGCFSAGRHLTADADRRNVAVGLTAALALVGFWTLWETLVGPPIATVSGTDRLLGPFGSAAFLGAFLALALPVAIGIVADPGGHRIIRWLAGLAATLAAVGVVGSGARAAWIGLGLAGMVACVRVRPATRRRLAGIGLAVVVAVGLIIALTPVGSVVERAHGSASRLDEWGVATRVIIERPLLGAGPEGYRLVVADRVTADYERSYGRSPLPDRAHSGPLDVAATIGIPGAIVFLGLVGSVCLLAVRRARSPVDLGLACGVVAYFGQQLLLFPLAEIDPLAWLLAGVALAAPGGRAETSSVPPVVSGVAGLPVGPLAGGLTTGSEAGVVHRRRIGTVIAFVAAGGVLVVGIAGVSADRLAKSALEASSAGRHDEARSTANRAVRLRPDVARYHLVLAWVEEDSGTLAGVDRAMMAARRALRWSPRDPILRAEVAGQASARAAITGTPGDLSTAVEAWRLLVADDPLQGDWQVSLGLAALDAGQVDLARTALQRAADLHPDDARISDLLRRLDELES